MGVLNHNDIDVDWDTGDPDDSVPAGGAVTSDAFVMDPGIAYAFNLQTVGDASPAADDQIEWWFSGITKTGEAYPLIDEGCFPLGTSDTFAAASGDAQVQATIPLGFISGKFIADGAAKGTTNAITVSATGNAIRDNG